MSQVMRSHGMHSTDPTWPQWCATVMAPLSMAMGTVRPSPRGSRSCLCSGVLQETKGHYGWILPEQRIEHPDASKHRGMVYLDTRDIRPGSPLRKGSAVAFYLYVDGSGLGAEDCHLKEHSMMMADLPGMGMKLARQQQQQHATPGRAAGTKHDALPATKNDNMKKKNNQDDDNGGEDTASTHSGTGGSGCGSDERTVVSFVQHQQPRAPVSYEDVDHGIAIISDWPLRGSAEQHLGDADNDIDATTAGSRTNDSTPEVMLVEPNYMRPPGDLPDPVASLLAELREARARASRLARRLDAVFPGNSTRPVMQLQAPPGLSHPGSGP